MTTRDAVTRMPWDAADPYPYYEAQRRGGDVVWDDAAGAWLILGYRAAREVLGGSGWTSIPQPGRVASPLADPDLLRRNMLTTDGVTHQRLRGAVRDVFTRSFVGGLEAGIAAIATQAIDAVRAGVEIDFMTEIALPLPIAVAAAWLDLEAESARLLRAESPAISRMLSDPGDRDAVEHGAAALAALLTELLPLAADRRRHPGDDLLSFIAADPTLELDDVITTAILIAVAGHETTANLLGSAMIRLLTAEGALPEPGDSLITELLRLDGPVQAVARTATCDHHLGGSAIRAGDPVFVVIAAANRDPSIFHQPDQLRVDRTGPAPLAFGHGAHFCLGAALARLEIGIALRHIMIRQPIRRGQPVWRNTPAIRGPQSVGIVLRQ